MKPGYSIIRPSFSRDMKSFSATGLAFVPEFVRRGLKRPVHFALSYDEEVGCVGVRRLIADIVQRGVSPLGCIIGEPTGMGSDEASQSTGTVCRIESAPPLWSESWCVTISPSRRRTPTARRKGATILLPASAVSV